MKKSNRYFQLLGGTPEGVVLKCEMCYSPETVFCNLFLRLCVLSDKRFQSLRSSDCKFPRAHSAPQFIVLRRLVSPWGACGPPASMNNHWCRESKTAFDRSRLQHPDRVLSAGKVAQEGRPLLSSRFSFLGVDRSHHPSQHRSLRSVS